MRDDLDSRQLDIEKVFKLSDVDKTIVMKMFYDLLDAYNSNFPNGGLSGAILYSTLVDNGFLITRREKKFRH